MAVPQRLTLLAPGDRENVDEDRANEFIQGWNEEIREYKAAVRAALGLAPDEPLPEDHLCPVIKISLTNKSYSAAAASIIASWLTRGDVCIASGIVSADLSDVIAGRPEDEALQVLQTLCDAFSSATIIEINLSDNAMGCKGISACRTVLSGQVESLQRLILSNNGLSAESMNEVADILTAGADDGSDSGCAAENLTMLHFHSNMSGTGGCHAFARILNHCTENLTDLRFSGTRAGRDGSLVVASAIASMGDKARNIRFLDLADNTFGVEGSNDLAQALRRMKDLTYLSLSECSCEDEGIKVVCHALWSVDAPLDELNLSGNDLTRSGAKPVADLLEENRTLKVFCAEDNELGSLGVKKIVAALAGPDSSIEEIRLSSNLLGRIGAAAIIDAYGPGGEGMAELRLIYLNVNSFPPESVEALQAAFGHRLVDMDENDDQDDADDGLSNEEDEEFEEEDDDVGHVADADIDALTAQVAGAALDHDVV